MSALGKANRRAKQPDYGSLPEDYLKDLVTIFDLKGTPQLESGELEMLEDEHLIPALLAGILLELRALRRQAK